MDKTIKGTSRMHILDCSKRQEFQSVIINNYNWDTKNNKIIPIIVLKFEQCVFQCSNASENLAGMVNSAGPYQTAPKRAV